MKILQNSFALSLASCCGPKKPGVCGPDRPIGYTARALGGEAERRGIAAAHTRLSTPVADVTLDTQHRRQVNPLLNKSLIARAAAPRTPSHPLAPRLLF